MKSPFITPRFEGGRFDGSLPIEVARDLAAYQDLIVALAKQLYLDQHPSRQRVPKGFSQGFRLDLEQLQEGSTKALIASFTMATAGLLEPDLSYFDSARDLVAECVRAKSENRPIPTEFPRKFLTFFNAFGKSLREDETVDITPDPNRPAVLTASSRKLLALEGQGYYFADVQLQGTVAKNEWEAGRFTLRLLEGTLVDIPLSPTYRDQIRAAGGNERTMVSMTGVAAFDATDKIRYVSTVSDLFTLPNLELSLEMDNTLPIEQGWLDGEGEAVDVDLREVVQGVFVTHYPESLPYPHVAPTESGGIHLEWVGSPWRVSAEFFPGSKTCELQATNASERQVVDLDLSLDDPSWWEGVTSFVSKFIGSVWD